MIIGLEASSLSGDFIEKIDWISRHFEELQLYFPQIADFSEPQLMRLVQGFKQVDLHAPFGEDISLMAADENIRRHSIEQVIRTMELSDKLSAKIVVIHSGYGEEKFLLESLWQLEWAAAEFNIKLALEVADYFEQVEKYEIVNNFSPPLRRIGITVDVGHLCFIHNGKPNYHIYGSISGFIRRYSNKVWLLHMHDYDGTSDHIAIGDGFIDFKAILKALKEINYSGALCFEFNPQLVSRQKILESKSKILELLS